MRIEDRLLHDYGTTDVPELGVWLLQNGAMVNGSIEGHQRDIDHRCISEYYKPSIRAQPGSSFEYILKFMRRGNIRMSCNEFGYAFETCRQPTIEQLQTLARCSEHARQLHIKFGIGRREMRRDRITTTEIQYVSMEEYLRYLTRFNHRNDFRWDSALSEIRMNLLYA